MRGVHTAYRHATQCDPAVTVTVLKKLIYLDQIPFKKICIIGVILSTPLQLGAWACLLAEFPTRQWVNCVGQQVAE